MDDVGGDDRIGGARVAHLVSHYTNLAIRIRSLGKAKTPFSRLSCSRLFSPKAKARASASRDACFSRARSWGSNTTRETAARALSETGYPSTRIDWHTLRMTDAPSSRGESLARRCSS